MSDFAVGADPGISYELDEDGGYQSSAPAQQDAYVGGSLNAYQSVDVAIAVNGRIGGWAETINTSRGNRFWTVLPPPFLSATGDDEVTVYAIQGDGPDPVLAPLTPAR